MHLTVFVKKVMQNYLEAFSSFTFFFAFLPRGSISQKLSGERANML